MARALAGLAAAVAQLASRRGLPSIHDITTDADNPPQFVALLSLRGGWASPAAYDGPAAAAQQRRAYPDIQPIYVDAPPSRALDAAAAVGRELGWDVIAVDAAAGTLEAVDTTFWFRFKDDIVVRVREEAGRTRLDLRSKSRLGRGDLGANARRIRTFTSALARRDL
jgi:uncharacterized protein (DUF1499 family)